MTMYPMYISIRARNYQSARKRANDLGARFFKLYQKAHSNNTVDSSGFDWWKVVEIKPVLSGHYATMRRQRSKSWMAWYDVIITFHR